jgi:hypothetical protein
MPFVPRSWLRLKSGHGGKYVEASIQRVNDKSESTRKPSAGKCPRQEGKTPEAKLSRQNAIGKMPEATCPNKEA